MTADHRAEIGEVILRYGSALDARDAAGVLACFTDDVHLEYFNGTVVCDGLDAAKDFFRLDGRGGLPGLDAMVSTIHVWNVGAIDVDGGSASANTACIAYVLGSAGGDGVLVTRGLLYRDDFRRTDVGWRISSRRHLEQWETRAPATSPLLASSQKGPSDADAP